MSIKAQQTSLRGFKARCEWMKPLGSCGATGSAAGVEPSSKAAQGPRKARKTRIVTHHISVCWCGEDQRACTRCAARRCAEGGRARRCATGCAPPPFTCHVFGQVLQRERQYAVGDDSFLWYCVLELAQRPTTRRRGPLAPCTHSRSPLQRALATVASPLCADQTWLEFTGRCIIPIKCNLCGSQALPHHSVTPKHNTTAAPYMPRRWPMLRGTAALCNASQGAQSMYTTMARAVNLQWGEKSGRGEGHWCGVTHPTGCVASNQHPAFQPHAPTNRFPRDTRAQLDKRTAIKACKRHHGEIVSGRGGAATVLRWPAAAARPCRGEHATRLAHCFVSNIIYQLSLWADRRWACW